MKIEKIKPIPKYILKLIVREEKIDRIYRPNKIGRASCRERVSASV